MTDERMTQLKNEGIDVFASLERLGNDMDLLEIIIGMFFKDAQANIDKCETSIASGNHEEVYNAVHTLKSLSGNLTMDKLYNMCTKACERYKAGSYDDCVSMYPDIKAEYNRVVKVLKDS